MINLLKENNIKISELAKELGYTDQRMAYIVKNKKFKPDYDLMTKCADFIGCSIDDILNDEIINS